MIEPNTPAPWTSSPTREDDEMSFTVLAKVSGVEKVVCVAETERDAKFIEVAVNLHAPMVHFLRWLVDAPGECPADHPDRLEFVKEILRAAGNMP